MIFGVGYPFPNSSDGLSVVCSREEGGSQSRFRAAAFLVHLTTPDLVLADKLYELARRYYSQGLAQLARSWPLNSKSPSKGIRLPQLILLSCALTTFLSFCHFHPNPTNCKEIRKELCSDSTQMVPIFRSAGLTSDRSPLRYWFVARP